MIRPDLVSPERAAANRATLARRIRAAARSLTLLAERVEADERVVSHFEHPVRLLADFADIVVAFEAWRRGEELP